MNRRVEIFTGIVKPVIQLEGTLIVGDGRRKLSGPVVCIGKIVEHDWVSDAFAHKLFIERYRFVVIIGKISLVGVIERVGIDTGPGDEST